MADPQLCRGVGIRPLTSRLPISPLSYSPASEGGGCGCDSESASSFASPEPEKKCGRLYGANSGLSVSIVRPGLAVVLRCGVIEGSHTHCGHPASQHLRRAEQRSCISAEQWQRQKEKRRFLEGKQLFLSFLLQLSEAASPKRPSSIPGSAACANVGRNYIGVPAVPEKLEPRLQACLASLPPVQAT